MRMKKRKSAAEILFAHRDKCCGDCMFFVEQGEMCGLRKNPVEVYKNKRVCAFFKGAKK